MDVPAGGCEIVQAGMTYVDPKAKPTKPPTCVRSGLHGPLKTKCDRQSVAPADASIALCDRRAIAGAVLDDGRGGHREFELCRLIQQRDVAIASLGD